MYKLRSYWEQLRSQADGQQSIICITENTFFGECGFGSATKGTFWNFILESHSTYPLFPWNSRTAEAGNQQEEPTTQQERRPGFTISAGRQIPKQRRRKEDVERERPCLLLWGILSKLWEWIKVISQHLLWGLQRRIRPGPIYQGHSGGKGGKASVQLWLPFALLHSFNWSFKCGVEAHYTWLSHFSLVL